MSYCRKNEDSDAYIINHTLGGWQCVSCELVSKVEIPKYKGEGTEWVYPCVGFGSLVDLKLHMEEHREAGHKIPEDAFQRVNEEIKNQE